MRINENKILKKKEKKIELKIELKSIKLFYVP